jgi:hypothetical protein
MTNYDQITKNYIKELEARKKQCEEELSKLDVAIISLSNIIIKAKSSSVSKKQTKRRSRPKKITESMVRDAVIYITKNPVDRKNRFPVDEGFFTQTHIREFLELTRYSQEIKTFLEKMVGNGILESRDYKNGKQYRYIKPENTVLPGTLLSPSSLKKSTYAEPVPGTGNRYHTIRNIDVKKMVKTAQEQGFIVERNGSDHLVVIGGDGKRISISTTGADKARYVENTKADLKRIGVQL